MERENPGTEVLNLGLSGYGHDQMLLAYRFAGERYHPDVVLVGYVWFDMYRDLENFTSYAKPTFTVVDDSLALHGVPVPKPIDLLRTEPWHSKLWEFLMVAYGRARAAGDMNREAGEQITSAIFDQIRREAKRLSATPVFVYFPVLAELQDTTAGYTPHERFLASYCAARHARCLFLRPAFLKAERAGQHFRTRSHWDGAAHALAAREIARYLADSLR
jgi:hypothetical protein